jgi:hypothetical protein
MQDFKGIKMNYYNGKSLILKKIIIIKENLLIFAEYKRNTE